MTQRIFVRVTIYLDVELKDWRTALRAVDDGSISLNVYVEPGASSQALGPYDPWRQRIKVRVTAPATEGKANAELADLIGGALGVPSKTVRIARGATTRRKTVLVEGVDLDAAIQALDSVLGEEDGTG